MAFAVIHGCDYSFDHPSAAELKAHGMHFACRYVYPHSQARGTKNLSKAEADELKAHGIEICSNYESNSGRADDGYAAGRSDAAAAQAQHAACGGPPRAPIFFSVDFDTTAADLPKIEQYFKGVASLLGLARTGAYGEYELCKHLIDKGLLGRSATAGKFYAWQTYAWSGGKYDERCAVAQDKNGVKLGSGTVDLDSAHAPDYGQWGYQAPTPAKKAPVSTPANKPAAKAPAKPVEHPTVIATSDDGKVVALLHNDGTIGVRKDGKFLYHVARAK